jgi:hypothetical protein
LRFSASSAAGNDGILGVKRGKSHILLVFKQRCEFWLTKV